MRILILGGTAWLGQALATTALADGHEVTCVARERSGAVPVGARLIRADRDSPDAFDAIAGSWNIAIDVSRQPGQVRRAVQALSPRCDRFVFVSSTNVYADHRAQAQAEEAQLLPALDDEVMKSMDLYGPAKVACERHVLSGFGPERALIARVGLIGGPGDVFDRTGYWPMRFWRAGNMRRAVLVPDTPDLATQVIDVRDLARWLVEAAVRKVAGTFNVTGETITFADHIDTARSVAKHEGELVRVPSEWLLARGVAPWMGTKSLPLWNPMADYAGFSARDSGEAVRAGLVRRPLAQTLDDTLAWERARPLGASAPRTAGLSDSDEAALLEEFLAERGHRSSN
jgi:nucleoside-diphosphate-sugar epimerase